MRRLPAAILFFCLAVAMVFPARAGTTGRHAAWVARWQLDSPEKIDELCREADGAFDTLLVQVRGRADAWYRSDRAPRAEELRDRPGDFDPLAEVRRRCQGKRLQAWLNVYYLWSGSVLPEAPSHPARPGRPWLLADRDGRPVSTYTEAEMAQRWLEGIYADPSSPAFRRHFIAIVDELTQRYPLDGVHLDFVRYPGGFLGLGEIAGEFVRQFGLDPRLLPESISEIDLDGWLNGEMNEADELLTTGGLIWAAMRAREVTELVRQTSKALRSSPGKPLLSAAVFPDYVAAFLDKGQDWLSWCRQGLVDEIYPMAYFGPPERVHRQIEEVMELTRGLPVRIMAGLGAWHKTVRQIADEAAGLPGDTAGTALFSLGHLMEKNGKSAPYVAAIAAVAAHNHPGKPADASRATPALARAALLAELSRIIAGNSERAKDGQTVIAARLASFALACRVTIPAVLHTLAAEPVQTPGWRDLHGILRFVHPHDPPARIDEQYALCQQARQKLLAGEGVERISGEFSQSGAKKFASRLPRRYLSPDREQDRELFPLRPGAVSRIFREDNGFCFSSTVSSSVFDRKLP